MLASFVVSLKPLAPAPLSDGIGTALHGLLFALVRQGDAALAARLHDANSARQPFTVSPLRGQFTQIHQHHVALPAETYWVRYTTLSDELFAALNAVLLSKYLGQETVTLCQQPFTISDVEVEPREHKMWGRLATVADIWQAAQPIPRVALRFHSATAFKQRGMELLFPVPRNVFQSYREKWNAIVETPHPVPALSARSGAFAPPHRTYSQLLTPNFYIDDGLLEWVEERVAVEAHQLETRHVPLGRADSRGFTGWARFVALAHDELRLKQLNALADFAFFCGTGKKTTHGMGQTARMSYKDSESVRHESGSTERLTL